MILSPSIIHSFCPVLLVLSSILSARGPGVLYCLHLIDAASFVTFDRVFRVSLLRSQYCPAIYHMILLCSRLRLGWLFSVNKVITGASSNQQYSNDHKMQEYIEKLPVAGPR